MTSRPQSLLPKLLLFELCSRLERQPASSAVYSCICNLLSKLQQKKWLRCIGHLLTVWNSFPATVLESLITDSVNIQTQSK